MGHWRGTIFPFSMTRDELHRTTKNFDSSYRQAMTILNRFGNQDFLKSTRITGNMMNMITNFQSKETASDAK